MVQLLLQDFRRHALKGASKTRATIPNVCTPTEVSDLQASVLRQEQIFQLYVTMHDVHGVNVLKTLEELYRQTANQPLWSTTVWEPLHVKEQVGDAEFHAEVDDALLFSGVPKLDDVSTTVFFNATSQSVKLVRDLLFQALINEEVSLHCFHREELTAGLFPHLEDHGKRTSAE